MSPAELKTLIDAATPGPIVASRYDFQDGSHCYQFESEDGGIAQTPHDYELHVVAKALLPSLVRLWEAAEGAVADDATCGTDERPCLMELTDIIVELRDTKGTP